jgi:WD40 repeat protein
VHIYIYIYIYTHTHIHTNTCTHHVHTCIEHTHTKVTKVTWSPHKEINTRIALGRTYPFPAHFPLTHTPLWQITIPHLNTVPSELNTEASELGTSSFYRTSRRDGTNTNLSAVEILVQGASISAAANRKDSASSVVQEEKVSASENLVREGYVSAVASNSVNENEVAMCGSDGMLRIWDADARLCVVSMQVLEEGELHSLAYSHDARSSVHLAVGMRGKILILNASNQLNPLPQVIFM